MLFLSSGVSCRCIRWCFLHLPGAQLKAFTIKLHNTGFFILPHTERPVFSHIKKEQYGRHSSSEVELSFALTSLPPPSGSTTSLCNHLTSEQRGPGLAYQWRNSQISNTPSLGASGISALATPRRATSSAQRRAATSTKGIPSYRLHVSMSALCICVCICVCVCVCVGGGGC